MNFIYLRLNVGLLMVIGLNECIEDSIPSSTCHQLIQISSMVEIIYCYNTPIGTCMWLDLLINAFLEEREKWKDKLNENTNMTMCIQRQYLTGSAR